MPVFLEFQKDKKRFFFVDAHGPLCNKQPKSRSIRFSSPKRFSEVWQILSLDSWAIARDDNSRFCINVMIDDYLYKLV
jgi:hypothetical protein